MKKLLTLGLVLMLVLSLFAGCAQKTEAPATETEAPATDTVYTDGTYFATYSHIDSHGWRPQVEITIEDGKITKAMMDYVKPDGSLKSKDEKYAETMKSKSGTAPAEAYAQLNEDLVAKQDITKVDSVSGATHSAEWFVEMTTAALEKAKTGDTSETVLPMNDTYTASEAEFDDHGWKSEIAITFKDDKIAEVVYNEVNDKGEKKRESEEYNTKMKAKSGVSAVDAQTALEKAFVDSQDIEAVDVVSGATSTSEKFKALAKEAMAKRVAYK
ncbi:FMN-binding protein [Clostridiaceae bacterium 35-E11]